MQSSAKNTQNAFLILGCFLVMLGCAPKPNLSIVDQGFALPQGTVMERDFSKAKAILVHISSQNELLAIELGKLPEVQDGVSSNELLALRGVAQLHSSNSELFDRAFDKMYRIGISDVRRYCSPLQALYWLFEDGRSKEAHDILQAYSLEKLIYTAWDKEINRDAWLEKEASKLVNSCNDKRITEMIAKYVEEDVDGSNTANYVISLAKEYPNLFDYTFHEDSYLKLLERVKARWSDFDIVQDRINAPELLHIYINDNYQYVKTFKQNPLITFRKKRGDCLCLALLGKQMLGRAGYSTSIRTLNCSFGSHVGLAARLNDGYLLAVDFRGGRKLGPNVIAGPYKSLWELDHKLCEPEPKRRW